MCCSVKLIKICTITVQATWVLPVERTTGLGCIPVDRTVSYECTVDDDGRSSTIWRGSAFNCTSSASTISLSHALFSGSEVTIPCGDLSAMSVGVSGSNYTSRLTLTATTALNGRTVECTRSLSDIFGNDTIRIGGKYNYAGCLKRTQLAQICIFWY